MWYSSSQNMAEENRKERTSGRPKSNTSVPPLLVLPLPGVGVLVGGGAVEVVQAEGVPGEVGGDPVHNDPNPRLMELVNEIL